MATTIILPARIFRPALMGVTCDACVSNPARATDPDAPVLAACPNPATVKFTIADNLFTYTFKRCDCCAKALRAKVERGGILEILSEETV